MYTDCTTIRFSCYISSNHSSSTACRTGINTNNLILTIYILTLYCNCSNFNNNYKRFTNNKILHQFETYDEIDEEVLCNILEAVKKNPIVVKMAHTYLEDDESEYGGIAFMGETLLDFLLSIPMSLTSTKEEINKSLSVCGIREI